MFRVKCDCVGRSVTTDMSLQPASLVNPRLYVGGLGSAGYSPRVCKRWDDGISIEEKRVTPLVGTNLQSEFTGRHSPTNETGGIPSSARRKLRLLACLMHPEVRRGRTAPESCRLDSMGSTRRACAAASLLFSPSYRGLFGVSRTGSLVLASYYFRFSRASLRWISGPGISRGSPSSSYPDDVAAMPGRHRQGVQFRVLRLAGLSTFCWGAAACGIILRPSRSGASGIFGLYFGCHAEGLGSARLGGATALRGRWREERHDSEGLPDGAAGSHKLRARDHRP